MAQDTILEVVRFEDDSTGTCRCYVGGAVSAWYSLRTASTKILAYEDDADDPDLVYYPGRVSYFPGELFFDHNDMPNWHREPARGFYEKEIDEERAGKVKCVESGRCRRCCSYYCCVRVLRPLVPPPQPPPLLLLRYSS